MSLNKATWSTAYARFGYGARGLHAPLAGDPREAVEAELAGLAAAEIHDPSLRSSTQALVTYYEYVEAQEQEQARAEALRGAEAAMPSPAAAASMIAPPTTPFMDPASAAAGKSPPPNPIRRIYETEARARLEAACAAPIGFVERLVAFWSNHFCISAAKGQIVRVAAGAFEREAIRPFVLGRFVDMLQAVERHQAMLHFLDNVQSVGPDSRVGRNAKRGLNENLAREILELHTLGVNGGYTQTDVTEFARVLTGWTVVGRGGNLGERGAYVFNPAAHEVGERNLLGRRYPQEGAAQGLAVLADLARSTATARHIAGKLARAFVADTPPAPLVDRLTKVFDETNGELGALARALATDEAAWSAPPTKLRDPWQMLAASYRTLALEPGQPDRLLSALALLGMPLWTPAGPNGFPDSTEAWLSPEGVKTRVEVAFTLASLAKQAPRPSELLDLVLLEPSLATREAVLRAESTQQAYALLILSPEFQRR